MFFNIIWICFCSFSYDFIDFLDEEMLFYVYQKMIVFAFFRDFGTLTRKFKKGTRVGCTLFFIKRKKFKSERSHGHLFGWVNGKLITLKKTGTNRLKYNCRSQVRDYEVHLLKPFGAIMEFNEKSIGAIMQLWGTIIEINWCEFAIMKHNYRSHGQQLYIITRSQKRNYATLLEPWFLRPHFRVYFFSRKIWRDFFCKIEGEVK